MVGLPDNNAKNPSHPLIVELVGPAGAGKSTLSRVLSQRDEKISIAAEIELRKIEHIPIFLTNFPFLLSILFSRSRSGRSFTWEEIKYLVYLGRWPRLLRQQASNNGRVILLDHGPVFKLATLDAFGPERLKSQDFENWWRDVLYHGASILVLVIWLDAPDAVLMDSMLVFIHINKTGGSTVRYILRSSFGLHHCEVEPWHARWTGSPFSTSDLQRVRKLYPHLESIGGH